MDLVYKRVVNLIRCGVKQKKKNLINLKLFLILLF